MIPAAKARTAAKDKVVFDTNVVLSALLFTHGRLSWLVDHWQTGDCVPLVTRTTAQELTRILAYPRFKLTGDEQLEALCGYISFCEIVENMEPCPVLCRDVKDQPFLDLAYCARADILVTGDRDLLALAGQTALVIETPEAYRLRITSAELNR
ncbi:MAG: putative toxin-antitoxin system toxin component, PIN family [Terracidiphilus sp.]